MEFIPEERLPKRATMNIRFLSFFIWALGLFLLSACVQRPIGTSQPPIQPREPGDELFIEAERLYADNEMDAALDAYIRYAARFPSGRHVDNAFRRMGGIYLKRGQTEEAQGFYQRLLDEYPRSRFAVEARLGLIDILAAGEHWPDAIQAAVQLLAEETEPAVKRQVQERLVGYYQAAGASGDAVLIEYALYRSAPEEEKNRWRTQIIEHIAQLDLAWLESAWDVVTDDDLRSYLMFRYAVVQSENGQYDNALEVVTVFLQRYPDHPYSAQAAILSDTLTQQLSFAPYTLGCLLPLTGPYQLYGTRALQGIEMALNLLQGGEEQLPIKLVIKDSASDDARAVAAVRELADARVGAILGPIATAQAAAQEAQRLHLPMITFTQKQGVTETGDYIFRHFITPQNQVRTLVDYFVNQVGLHDFAILYPKEAYGDTFMSLFWDEVIHQGGRVVGVESYDAQMTDFAEPIKKLTGTYYPIPAGLKRKPVVKVEENPYFQEFVLSGDRLEGILPDPVRRLTGLYFQQPDQDRARGPAIGRIRQDEEEGAIVDFDVLFIPDAPKKAGLVIPQLLYHDIKDVYLAGTNLWHSSQLVEMAQEYLNDAVLVEGFFKGSASGAVRRFVEMYEAVYKEPPGILEAYAFDTARLIFDLLAKPDLQLRPSLRDALKQSYTADGVTGFTAFDDQGEPLKRLSLLGIKRGQFVEIVQP